jgi:hypothetical protein
VPKNNELFPRNPATYRAAVARTWLWRSHDYCAVVTRSVNDYY